MLVHQVGVHIGKTGLHEALPDGREWQLEHEEHMHLPTYVADNHTDEQGTFIFAKEVLIC